MNIRLIAASAAFALLTAGVSAHASTITTYTLSNVGLTNGVGGSADGTLSGTFTFNSSTNMLTAADITATPGVAPASHTGGGYEFILGGGSANSNYTGAGFSSYFTLTSIATPNDVLFLSFASALNGTTPDAVLTSSYENELTLGVRNVGSGGSAATVGTAVAPEPSSIALLGTGLLGLGGLIRRRLA